MTTLASRRSPERTQFLLDLLTTACEGGIGYWCFILDYDIWENPGAATVDLVPKKDPRLKVFDFQQAATLEPDLSEAEWKDLPEEALLPSCLYELNIDVMARGLRRAWATGKPTGYWTQLQRADRTNGRDGDYDSTLADAVAQYGIFGDVRYG